MAVLQESPREGADHLQHLLAQNPADPRIKYTLAGALRSVGRPDEARRLLDEVLASNPNNVATLLERGRSPPTRGTSPRPSGCWRGPQHSRPTTRR